MSAPLWQPSQLDCATRPNDLDSLGHVNHAVALEYLEAGRWDWFARNGLQRSGGATPVVARVEVDYLQQLFPGTVTVHTELLCDPDELTYRAPFRQQITVQGADGSALPAIEARISVAFIDLATKTLCSLQDYVEHNASAAVPEAA